MFSLLFVMLHVRQGVKTDSTEATGEVPKTCHGMIDTLKMKGKVLWGHAFLEAGWLRCLRACIESSTRHFKLCGILILPNGTVVLDPGVPLETWWSSVRWWWTSILPIRKIELRFSSINVHVWRTRKYRLTHSLICWLLYLRNMFKIMFILFKINEELCLPQCLSLRKELVP